MPKILIIDEEETSREMLSVYSEMLGYETLSADKKSACCDDKNVEGTCSDDNACADILLVNQKSSNISGLDFIEKRMSGRCKVPIHNIAILSGDLSPQEFRKVKKLGCHCLQKPVSFEILENWLKKVESKADLAEKTEFN